MNISDDVKALTSSAKDVPGGSVFLQRIKTVLQEAPFDLSRLPLIFQTGSPYEVQILRLVNSNFFGFRRMVSSLNQAATYLGIYGFYQVALLCEICHVFGSKAKSDLSREDFWKHSFACGIASLEIARHMGYPRLYEAFTAGVLHDIGKLFWDQYLTNDFSCILSRVREKDILILTAEQELMNVTHSELGYWLLCHWEVYPIWNTSVLYHHDPERYIDQDPLVAMVHVADIISRSLLLGNPGDEKIPVMNEKAFQVCQLTTASLEYLLERVDDSVAQTEKSFLEGVLST